MALRLWIAIGRCGHASPPVMDSSVVWRFRPGCGPAAVSPVTASFKHLAANHRLGRFTTFTNVAVRPEAVSRAISPKQSLAPYQSTIGVFFTVVPQSSGNPIDW